MKNNRLIVVLGMHRSGTSVITRALKVFGAELGDNLIGPIEHVNEKGFWEDFDLTMLNEEILNALKNEWYCIELINDADLIFLKENGFFDRAVEMLTGKIKTHPIYGFKDPRAAKLLPFWKQVFDYCMVDVCYVLAIRNPRSVAMSLEKRDGMSLEQSYLLWLAYLTSSFKYSAGQMSVVVDYDILMKSPVSELNRTAQSLQLHIDEIEMKKFLAEFLDDELRHSNYFLDDLREDPACLPIVYEAYSDVLLAAKDQVNIDDRKIQDRITTCVDELSSLKYFTRLVDKQYRKTIENLNNYNRKLNEYEIVQNQNLMQIANLNDFLDDKIFELEMANKMCAEKEVQLVLEQNKVTDLVSSTSWHITKPFRFVSLIFRGEFRAAMHPLLSELRISEISSAARKSKIAFSYLFRSDIRKFKETITAAKLTLHVHKMKYLENQPKCPLRWGIMTSEHTIFIAGIIQEKLKVHGCSVEVFTSAPPNFDLDCYIVICPQIFQTLPPGERRVCFQVEQSVSSRWFTPEYFQILESSLAVLDYSLINIDYLSKNGIVYPHVYYLPIGATRSLWNPGHETARDIDVLFYGDRKSSPRRLAMLDVLSEHFNVVTVDEVFDHEMRTLISRARVVINIHYYENALLEMPRIQECLSLGAFVVSESARDQRDYPELAGAVSFFEQGMTESMITAVKAALENPVAKADILKSVEASADRFEFNVDRFLISIGFLNVAQVNNMNVKINPLARSFALSLPETIERRLTFESIRPEDCFVFDGIRRQPGWLGCGLSYSALARSGLKLGLERMTIMEDDVLLPEDYMEKLSLVNRYLDKRGDEWDVFSGLMAVLHPDTTILSVDVFEGVTFVTINKMMSMVFNIYGKKILKLLSRWNPENVDSITNTIDRYLESHENLKVVVMLPFFVGHREELRSTLWGIQNNHYNDMILNCEQNLQKMVSDFEHSNSIPI